MDLYREEILEHWKNPQNFGEIKNADLVIDQINPLCGDQIRFFFNFEKKGNPKSEIRNPKIIDVSFTGNGCAISIASASMLSQYIKGKKISAISKIVGKDILEMLGGDIAPARLKCAFLPLEAIKKINTNT